MRQMLVNKNYFITAIFLMLLMGIFSVTFSVILTVFLICIIIECVKKTLNLNADINNCICLALILGGISVLFLYIGYTVEYESPYWIPGQDDFVIEQDAFDALARGYRSVSNMVNSPIPRESLHNAKGYVIFLMYVMKISDIFGGYHTLIPRLINILFINLSALLMVKYAEEFRNFSEASIKKLYLFITLFPNMLYIGSHIYRDVLASFLLVLVFYLINQIYHLGKRLPKVGNILLIILDAYCSYWIRAESIVFIFFIILITLYYNGNKRLHINDSKVKLLRIVAFPILVVLISVGVGNVLSRSSVYLTTFTESATRSGRTILSVVSGVSLFPFGIVLRSIAYLVSPFYSVLIMPWYWFDSFDNFVYIILSIGTLYMISQYIYALHYGYCNWQLVFICLVILGMIISTTMGYRHVVMLYPFLITLLVEGRSMAYEHGNYAMCKKESILLPITFFAMFTFIYYIML